MELRLGTLADMPADGRAKEFNCDGKWVCVARVDGRLSAMDNVCPHRGGPLGTGVVMDGKVVCPWHGWQFDPQTGECVQADASVPVYKLRVDGEEVFVEVG